MTPSEKKQAWITQAKSRGLSGALEVFLDLLEPLSPLGAQVLWILQPVSGLLGWQKAVGEIAKLLEEPNGMEQLRHRLEISDLEDDTSGDTLQ